MVLAHVIGESWHMADLLLYGGAGVGLCAGIGLFAWGRRERLASPPPQVPDTAGVRREALIRRS